MRNFVRSFGDLIYLYTDGVTEATDAKNELFSDERLLATMNRLKCENLSKLLADIKAGIDAFVGEAPQFDDITMQLITEELVVMILLQMISPGMPMQYFITCDHNQGIVTLAMGYPGAVYNPFEMEENIFMINIFREWITEIQFQNPDNQF